MSPFWVRGQNLTIILGGVDFPNLGTEFWVGFLVWLRLMESHNVLSRYVSSQVSYMSYFRPLRDIANYKKSFLVYQGAQSPISDDLLSWSAVRTLAPTILLTKRAEMFLKILDGETRISPTRSSQVYGVEAMERLVLFSIQLDRVLCLVHDSFRAN